MITNKKGVSLVAVLLFMLVATIAGTATYRWLSSAGGSSAARMQMQEAEHAAKSGIESARSWMTYHGSETGAIIRQYLKAKNPVLLDSVLVPVKRDGENYSVWVIGADIQSNPYKIKLLSFGKSANGQAKYSKSAILNVNGLYRVKVPKEAKAAPFEESLYSGPANGISLDVTSSIVNGDAKFNTMVDVQKKLVVTGDMSVNSSSIFKNLYVHGNMYTCTNFSVTEDTYVGGMVYLNGSQTYGGDFYAEGGIDMSGTGTGKAQCSTGSGASLSIGGKVSSNGNIILPKHTSANTYEFKGNVVVGNGGKLIFPDAATYGGMIGSQGYVVNFLGNVYLDGGINADGFHLTMDFAPNVKFGSSGKDVFVGSPIFRVSDADGKIPSTSRYYTYWGDGNVKTDVAHKVTYRTIYGTEADLQDNLASNVFCNKDDCAPSDKGKGSTANQMLANKTFYNCTSSKDVEYWLNGVKQYASVGDNCEVARNEVFFQVNGNLTSSKPDTNGWGANRQQDVADAIIETPEGNCKGPHMKEPLQFNKALLNSSFLHSVDKKGACMGSDFEKSGNSFWDSNNSIDRWGMLESCYAKAKDAKELYDDKWLLIKFDGSNGQFQNVSSSDMLTHNYIIIFENRGDFYLPATSADANVMMYWPDGGNLYMMDKSDYRNYFIYSEKDIAWNASEKTITGSLFLTDCHEITGVNTISIKYNSSLTGTLTNSAIMCDNDGTSKCTKSSSGGSGDGSGAYDSFLDDGYDQYFVPISPQLLLTVESEYKSKKTDLPNKNGTNITPSIVVMPRVLYLSRMPAGKLSDYYDVKNMNGAKEVKDESKVYCTPTGLPTTEKFNSYSDSLKVGVYKCVYRTEAYEDSPFYVVIENTSTTDMSIAFAQEKVEIARGVTVDVPVKVPAGSSTQPISVDVYVEKPSAWTVTPKSAHTGPTTNANGSLVYTLNFTPGETEQTVNVFEVTMPDADNVGNAATFQLIPPCKGCVIGAPPYLGVVTTGSVTVKRESVSKYCDGYPANCKEADGTNKYYSVINAPECTGQGLLSSSDIWVYASGIDCAASVSQPNDLWTCNMNHVVSLAKKSLPTIEKYCDIVIPPYDNTFSATFDGQEGILYASVARKTKSLSVSVVGAGSSNSLVRIKKSSNTQAKEPDSDDSEICLAGNTCQFVVYPGYRYFLYAEVGSSDDKFSYFKCSGKDCPSNAQIMASNPYELSVQEDNNSIVARFNDKDDHCFYEDFTPSTNSAFTAFCGRGQTRCIDTCATTQRAGKSCSISESAVVSEGDGNTPDWVMVYNNGKPLCSAYKYDDHTTCTYSVDFGLVKTWHPLGCTDKIGTTCGNKAGGAVQLAPTIANNYITAKSSAYEYANYQNGTQSVILSTKDAGYNGTMTSLFTTSVKPIPNTGFIFRSNDDASEYFSLSVYGKAYTTVGSIYAASKMFARLCYVNGQAVENSSSGVEKCFEKELEQDQTTVGSTVSQVTVATSFTMALVLDGSSVSASFVVDRTLSMDGKRSVSFDLSSLFGLTLADEYHNRVGMKLSDEHFNIHDIAWMSQNYKGECWAAPKIVCSFKSNYLGGVVPKDEDVTPWVSYSSFLSDDKYRNCKLKFYYNGCDMNVRNYTLSWKSAWNSLYQIFSCTGSNPLGTYWDNGSPISGDFYSFNREGKHGYYVPAEDGRNAGYAMDAKVLLDCSSDPDVDPPSSLVAHQTCGEFMVGKLEYCSENYEYEKNADAISCLGGCIVDARVERSVANNGTTTKMKVGTNLRDANLEFRFDNPDNVQIKIVLVDDGGIKSNAAIVTGTEYTLDVSSVSDVDNFNPQAVEEIQVTSEGNVGLYSVISVCPYALGITGCSATYNGISWIVKANVTNAYSCDVTPSLSLDGVEKKTGVLCGENAEFSFGDEDRVEKASSSISYDFTIRAYNADKSEYVERVCEASTDIKPITLECELEKEDGVARESVMKGTGIPGFSFKFENCDQFSNKKCNYVVSIEGYGGVEGSTEASGQESGSTNPFNTINQPASPLESGATWKVTGPGGTSCEKSFTVYSSTNNASASTCALSDEGNFIGYINSTGPWEASLSISDAFGFVKANGVGLKKGAATSEGQDYEYTANIPLTSLATGDKVVLVLNGVSQTNCSGKFGVDESGGDSGDSGDDNPGATDYKTLCHYVNGTNTHNSWVENFGPGTYVWRHKCRASPGWWVYCNGSVTVNGTSYQCEQSSSTTSITGGNYTVQNSVPPSGSLIVVPEGVTIRKIGCEEDPGVPVGCEGQDSNTVVTGTTSTTPAGTKTLCLVANGAGETSVTNVAKGKYGILQNCYSVSYKCTGDVKINGTPLNCGESEQSYNFAVAYGGAVPVLEIGPAGKLDYLKCPANMYAWAVNGCSATGILDEEPPEYIGTAGSCKFDKNSYAYGESAVFKFKYMWNFGEYGISDPSGTEISSGTVSSTANQEMTYTISNPVNGEYSFYLKNTGYGYGSMLICKATAHVDAAPVPPTADCEVEAGDDGYRFKAKLSNCSGGCNWYLKKDGEQVESGSSTQYVGVALDDFGSYTLHLGSSGADAACTESIQQPLNTSCHFANNNVKAGTKLRFTVEDLVAKIYTNWKLLDPDGKTVDSGKFLAGWYGHVDWSNAEATVQRSGTYTFQIEGKDYCRTNLDVIQSTATNCRLDNTSVNYGSSTTFRFRISDCTDYGWGKGSCKYEVLDPSGNVIASEEGVADKDGYVTVSSGGTYKVKVNGVLTDCSATLTKNGVAVQPGTYDYAVGDWDGETNGTIEGPFIPGSYTFNMNRACSKAQVHAGGVSGATFTLNGGSKKCEYQGDYSISAKINVSLEVGSGCEISKIYFSGCKKQNQ